MKVSNNDPRNHRILDTALLAAVLTTAVIFAGVVIASPNPRTDVVAKGKDAVERTAIAGEACDVPSSDRTPEHCGDPQANDTFDPELDAARAYHGNIFIATVNSVLREETEPVAPGIPDDRVIYYQVTVDKSLAGSAEGTVTVAYRGADFESPEHMGFGELRLGAKYMLFAGRDPETSDFLVTSGTGTILITHDAQEDALVKQYRRELIPTAEATERELIAEATAWAEVRADRAPVVPEVSVAPEGGPGGTTVTVSGKGFSYPVVMIVLGEDITFGHVDRESGRFDASIVIPDDAEPGRFSIVVDDDHGLQVVRDFVVER